MIAEKQVVKLAAEFLKGTDLFLIEVLVKPTNKISVFIDGLQGVTIEGCQQLSRHIEEHLDRETEDFDLTVSSPGADRPLKHPRQYTKNLGKELEIVTVAGDKFIGKVVTADENGVTISYAEKKSKKSLEEKVISLLYANIKSAKEVITFKK
jgi:ribosome maturation factor RimP